MKRSAINKAIIDAGECFMRNGWSLPPNPKWDITDFGLDSFLTSGLVLVNLAEEKEYCEKIMYAISGQVTPCHTHKKKKEDIICRTGLLVVQLWAADPAIGENNNTFKVKVNGSYRTVASGDKILVPSGQRITIEPGVWHEFYPESDECIIGEVSTANDDVNDNFFSDENIGRFAEIEEDEALIIKLVSEY